ncbi:UDP-N-acetylglucosamine 2-epimerase (non-hydrolyzing) [candidate division KSB1 bacterium]|nr:UDP-N-acetylglucosamine 2-epimerase (non-hydrolyzing) [candidate division KSB1 bacterium]
MRKLKIINVVGARPNFMKIAPIVDEMRKYEGIEQFLLHTGQHYDHKMSDLFFNHLGLPKPDCYLGVGSGGHGLQTGKVMIEFEEVVKKEKPDIVLVVGDVNSTIACSLVAVKMGVKVVHVEAGLRSFDRTMPEEINRILTDQISDYLFLTEKSAFKNLENEGIDTAKAHFVGNVMIDSLLKHREKASTLPILEELEIEPRNFALVTLHRPANVDDPVVCTNLIKTLCTISEKLPVVFPVHPRTRKQMSVFGLDDIVAKYPNLRLIEPMGYLDFLKCTDNAKFVLTDSGGIQEETTVLGVPCITARDNTERPITAEIGTNVIVGRDTDRLLAEANKILAGEGKKGEVPELWDGKAAERIVKVLWEREGE